MEKIGRTRVFYKMIIDSEDPTLSEQKGFRNGQRVLEWEDRNEAEFSLQRYVNIAILPSLGAYTSFLEEKDEAQRNYAFDNDITYRNTLQVWGMDLDRLIEHEPKFKRAYESETFSWENIIKK
jgi:hypothetical protein